jgi:hypothetical protein
MNQIQFRQQAANIAEAHLRSLRIERPSEWMHVKVDENRVLDSEIWWSDYIELFEVPFVSHDGTPCGYALISVDSRLPPVLQYTSTGETFSKCISLSVASQPLPKHRGTEAKRITFITSTQFYIELTLDDGTNCLLDPINHEIHSRYRTVIPRLDPATLFDQTIVRQQWADLLRQPAPGDSYVIPNAAPILYNQDCENGALFCELTLDTPASHCAPFAISGCSPVAWGMLASSYKKLNLKESAKIWEGSTDWNQDWPTSDPRPSRSDAVRKSIWAAHGEMGTSVNGATSHTNLVHGQNIFRQMGIGWNFKSDQYRWYDFYDTCRRDRPAIWSPYGPWRNLSLAGHSVVVYGFRHADTSFLVGLGWGSSWQHTNINYGQFDKWHGEFADF